MIVVIVVKKFLYAWSIQRNQVFFKPFIVLIFEAFTDNSLAKIVCIGRFKGSF